MTLISMIIKFLLCGIIFSFIIPFWAKKSKNDINPLALFGVLCIIFCLILFFPYGLNKKPVVEQKTKVDYPSFTSPVVDEIDLLSSSEREQILNTISQLKDYQLAVVILKDTRGLPVQEYTLKLAKTWAIGEAGKNNGVLFSIVPSARKVRIDTGYGTEESLTDMKLGMILDDYVVPYFKKDNIPQGIISGTQAIVAHLNGEELPASEVAIEEENETDILIFPESSITERVVLGFCFLFMCVLGVVVILAKFPKDISACLIGFAFFCIGAGLILIISIGDLLGLERFGAVLLLIGIFSFIKGFFGGGGSGWGGGASGGGSDFGGGGGGDFGGGGAGRDW